MHETTNIPALPAWAWVLIAVLGSGAFWGWAKALSRHRFGTINWLLNEYKLLNEKLAVMERRIGEVDARELRLRHAHNQLVGAYRRLAALSQREINRLRALLQLDPVDRWPPAAAQPQAAESSPP